MCEERFKTGLATLKVFLLMMLIVASWALAQAPVYGQSSAQSANSYVGLIATRAEVPISYYNGNTWFSDRSGHWTRSAVASNSMQIVWSNYYLEGGGEQNPGSATYKAAIEYPLGTITPCIFGGQQTITVAGLTDVITDPCGGAIPNSALFWVRVLRIGGIIYSQGENPGLPHYSPTYDSYDFGRDSPVDTVYSGMPSRTDGALAMLPSAIIGLTTSPSICLAGDSRAKGIFDAVSDYTGDTGELARLIGPSFAYTKLAAPGELGSQALGNYANRSRLLAYCTHVINEYGVNDLNSNNSVTAFVSTRAALDALFG